MSGRTVLVVDDDKIFAKALGNMLTARGYSPLVCHDTTGALLHARQSSIDCAVIDYNLGAVLGTALMLRLQAEGHDFPVIILTGFGDVPTATMAMKLGATDFLEKPHDPEKLTAAIDSAIEKFRERSGAIDSIREARLRLRMLSQRESEIVDAIVAGCTTKQIAVVLGLGQRTVDASRATILRKLGLTNVAELIRIAVLAGLARPQD